MEHDAAELFPLPRRNRTALRRMKKEEHFDILEDNVERSASSLASGCRRLLLPDCRLVVHIQTGPEIVLGNRSDQDPRVVLFQVSFQSVKKSMARDEKNMDNKSLFLSRRNLYQHGREARQDC